MKLSIVIATRNEEENIEKCLESVRGLTDEIVVVDEYSTDRTREVAQKFGAKVYLEEHHDIFHVTKQKALDCAKGDWILQLDADEVVTSELAKEIKKVVSSDGSPKGFLRGDEGKQRLFERHQALIEKRDGPIGKKTGEIVGYFIPRRNMFLGKPLIHAGVYPDGVIRLVKKGKAHFPQKSVHEQIQLDGEVSWLGNDLLHYDSPSLKRYFKRFNVYTSLKAQEFANSIIPKNFWSFLHFTVVHPTSYFLLLYIRHKGFLDGVPGFLWSFFSALHFPIAYFKYLTDNKSK